jgi:SNF2 family DNA or RNA helicase
MERALSSEDGFAFFFCPGTGKTLTTISTLRNLYNRDRRIAPTLILAPVIVLENWKAEWEKFSKVDPERVVVLSGPIKKRIATIDRTVNLYGDGVIFITNYDPLYKADFLSALMGWGPEYLVLDESHKVKTHNSKRSKACHQLSKIVRRCFLLSGTPILNNSLDIFSQYLCLDKGKRFGKNFFTFRNKYFYDKNAGMPKDRHFPDWQPRKDTYPEMNKLIYEVAMRAKKSDCLDLPPLIQKTVEVELSPEQKRLYKSMERDFIAFLEDSDKAIVAQLAITKTLRMRQILSGFIKTDDDKITLLKRTPREAALEELLEEITGEHKVLVWSVFKAEYEIIRKVCKRLKLPFVEAHGGISNKAKYEAVEAFNTDPKVRVFIGHPGALGIGINLVASSYSIYYSRDYSLEQRDQSQARNYRGGSEQHESITHIDIVAKETIDEVILKSLENKTNIAEEILAWKKSQ